MALEDITLKIRFIFVVGSVISICLIGGSHALWHHDYRLGTVYFAVGTVLTLLFYRKRLFLLGLFALVFVFVNAGLTVAFHPSLVGYILTFGSGAGVVVLVRWHTRKHPELQGRDWRKIWF